MWIFPCKDKVGGKGSHQDQDHNQDHNQDQDVKEDDGEDVDDAQAALGRWKAGERTGVSLEELRSSSCDSLQQQLRQRQLLMQEASWTENSTL